ncbi:iron uptake system protein EfeO [Nakamurella deserti]|uniref:iron uptake system protein EfeO n=1 Tax=Nakamurella deserti TaxID=2164074 RepID=UPI000DBE320D|nr:iron uptake system protein EfeO [Nakamurella deserti]
MSSATSTRRRAPRLRTATAVALAGVVLAGCGSAASGASPAPAAATSTDATTSAAPAATGPAGEAVVAVAVTDAGGCVATPDTVPAGAVTFNVTNVDAVGVSEVELLSDQRIRGERENLAPGFDATFTATLDGGSYELYCPGASTDRTPFTVTGEAAVSSGDTAALLQQATVDYADYIDSQVGFLTEAVAALQTAIDAGDLTAAQNAYAAARPYYERIEPVAESFGDLDPAIDLRIGDVGDPAAWTGFHPIEQLLFEGGTTVGAEKLAATLVTDIGELQSRTAELSANTRADAADGDRYLVDEVANGAVALLGEVQASKITGEEEFYSKIDLLDFQANVEGSLQAFAALKPALNEIDPALVTDVGTRFDTLLALLDTHRDPAAVGGFTLYDDLTDAQITELSNALSTVIEPLSVVPSKIATA